MGNPTETKNPADEDEFINGILAVCFVYYVFRFQLLAFGFQLREAFSCVLCVSWLNLYSL